MRVVTKNRTDLSDWRGTNVLTQAFEDLFVHVVDPATVRVGTAARAGDTEGFAIHGANGLFVEVPLTERSVTDDERTWCEGTFTYRDTETVWEFEIPRPEALRAAILDEDLAAFDEMDAVIRDPDHRHRVLTDLQERIEGAHFRATKLNRWKGQLIDLAAEWNPESDATDKSRAHLYDMAAMQKDAHLQAFEVVAGFPYRCFFTARCRVLGIHEPKLDSFDLVALDVVGADDWSYCRECGAVAPEGQLFHVELRAGGGRTRRVCDGCLDQNAGWIELLDDERRRGPWTEAAAARARDEQAQREGGQRRVQGEYDGD